MANSKEFNTDIDVKGIIKATSVPNRTGVPMVYDASTNTFSHRTAQQFINDYGLEVKNHTHSWSQITGKPSTFTPSTHTHTAREIKVSTSDWEDNTGNRLELVSGNNNSPNGSTVIMGAIFPHTASGYATVFAGRNKNFYVRSKENGTWTDWYELYHTGNLNPVTINTTQTITGSKVFQGNIAVPNATANNHALNRSYADGRYAEKSHTHSISDITNLQSTLNNKANTEHSHEIEQVIGLQSQLNQKTDLIKLGNSSWQWYAEEGTYILLASAEESFAINGSIYHYRTSGGRRPHRVDLAIEAGPDTENASWPTLTLNGIYTYAAQLQNIGIAKVTYEGAKYWTLHIPQSTYWHAGQYYFSGFLMYGEFLYNQYIRESEAEDITHQRTTNNVVSNGEFINLPKNVSELTNDANYATESYVDSKDTSILQQANNHTAENYVPLEGATTKNGTLTLTSPPVIPNATLDSHAVNRGYGDGRYANISRTITAGTGLTGGGSLAGNRTINFDTTWGDNRYAGKDYEKKIDVIDVRTLPNGSTTYDPKPSELNSREAGFYFNMGVEGLSNTWRSILHVNGWNNTSYSSWQLIGYAGESRTSSEKNRWFLREGQGDNWDEPFEIYHTGNLNPVETSRTITAGTGLTGGGNLSANRTISFDTSWGDNRYALQNGNYASLRARGTTKADVGLGNVPNWSGSTSTSLGTSNTVIPSQGAVKAYVDNVRSQILGGSPAALDTLYELAAALGNDPNFSTTVMNEIGTKVPQTRTITAGTGLTGGGSLAGNRTINFDTTWGDGRYSLTGHSHSWTQITGKPSTFTPSSHTHTWGQITGKPSTFAPSSHEHEYIKATTSNLDSNVDDRGRLTYQSFSSSASGQSFATNNANGVITMISHGGPYGKQIAFADTDDLYMRRFTNGNYQTWRKIWHDGNSDSFSASGNYASLRARGTTKADVGLGNVPNWSGSTSTSLGTSNTVIPSQGAVKSYIDSGLSGKANTTGTYSIRATGTTKSDVGLGNVPNWSGSTSTSLGTSNTTIPSQGAVKSYVDSGLAGKADSSGTYSGLRAQATTKADVGLGSVDNYSRSHYDGRYAYKSHNHSASDINSGVFSKSRIRTIDVPDTRNVDTHPDDLNKSVDFEFKSKTTVNNTISDGSYLGVMTFSPYSDDSGGPKYQLSFGTDGGNGKGQLNLRTGTRSNGWYDWIKIWSSGNLNPVTLDTTQTITGTKTFTKQVTAPDFTATSDARLKENITEYIPVKLKTTYKNFNFIENNQDRVGVLAQELEEHHPEFVRTNKEGTKSVSYIDLHSAEIAYLKSQNGAKDKKIASLEERLSKLEKLLL